MLFARRRRPDAMERLRIALWPRRSFARSFRYYKLRVLRLNATPHAIAAGVAAGAFASCTPLVGFHFILAFVLAYLIGGNLIAAAFGTAVGNPLTFPIIWVSAFQIGEAVLGGASGAPSPLNIQFSFETITSSFSALWPTLKPMLIGGALMGLPIGAVLYLLTRSAVMMSQAMRANRVKTTAARRETAARDHERAG